MFQRFPFCTFIFHDYTFSLVLGGKQLLTCQVKGTNREIHSINHNIQVKNADSGRKQTTFSSIFSLIGLAFSTFRQKMVGPNPSEMAMKVFIFAPTCCLQFGKCVPYNGKDYICPLVTKIK